MQITITINNPLPAVNDYLNKQIKSERFQAAVERFNTHRPKSLIQHATNAVGYVRTKVAAIDVKSTARTVLITTLELL